MAKSYQICCFSYINNKRGMNTLNGTRGDAWAEVIGLYNIVCFDGIGYFKSPAGCFLMHYPKIGQLTLDDYNKIYMNNGYTPEAGEYGPICSTFGTVKKISEKAFKEVMRDLPIKKKDYKHLDWLNGNLDDPQFVKDIHCEFDDVN